MLCCWIFRTSQDVADANQVSRGNYERAGRQIVQIHDRFVQRFSHESHIDDLKWLPDTLEHKFDVVGISETKIRESIEPLTNKKLPGYEFIQIATKSHFGGVGFFVKQGINYKIRDDLSKSIFDVSESIFIELTDKSSRNLLVGCIYRHPSFEIDRFIESFFKETVIRI